MADGLRRMAWSPREAATIARLPVKHIYAAIHAGELPAVRLGKHYRISDTNLRQYLAETPQPVVATRLHYTAPQVSEIVGVPVKTVYADIKSGALQAELNKGKYRITHDALCAYAAYDATA